MLTKAILGVIVSANIKLGKVPDELVFDAYVGLLGKWSLIEMNLQVFMFSVKVFKNEMPADDLATGVIFLKKMSEDDRSRIDTFRRTLTLCYADLRTREPDTVRLVGINLDDGDESANSKATNRIDHQQPPALLLQIPYEN